MRLLFDHNPGIEGSKAGSCAETLSSASRINNRTETG